MGRRITSCLTISNPYISLKDETNSSLLTNLFTLVLQVRIWSLTSSECTVTLKGHKVRGGTERGLTIQKHNCRDCTVSQALGFCITSLLLLFPRSPR